MIRENFMNKISRRKFMATSAVAAIGFGTVRLAHGMETDMEKGKNKISLATWSLNRTYARGMWELKDIPRICRDDFGIDGIEYVTNFFTDVRDNYLRPLKKAVADYNTESVLIMVDREGHMVAKDKQERMQAALNHRKWVEIAAYLGCHAIRCNATISDDREENSATAGQDPDAIARAVESFSALLAYAREFKINIIVEPHGSKMSRDPKWLVELTKNINDPLFGLLPDFGNFDTQTEQEVYEAVRLTVPYAKGMSVKGGWLPDGTHERFSLDKCLQLAVDGGFSGYWGIESGIRRDGDFYTSASTEDIKKDEWQAVLWTKQAIERIVK